MLLDLGLPDASELERTRQAVEAHRALSRSILRSLPDHIAVLDGDGQILGTNEAWRRFAVEGGGEPRGYEGENYLETTRRAAGDGDGEAARMLEGLQGVLSGARSDSVAEYPCHGPDAKRWFRASATPLREGPTEGAVVSHIDVTDRKRAEEQLEEERERLAEIFRRAPAWMATMRGPEHVFEMANPFFRELVGDRDVVDLPARQVFPELEGEGFFELLDRVYRTGEPVEVEEKALRLEREDRVETKYITFANPAAEELFDVGAGEIADRAYDDPAWEILGPDGEPMPGEELPFRRVRETGEPVTGVEHTVRRGDGERVRVSVNAAPVGDGDGRVSGVVASIRDVTRERFEAASQLRRLREMGCRLGQGYLYARPMPAGEMEELLAAGPLAIEGQLPAPEGPASVRSPPAAPPTRARRSAPGAPPPGSPPNGAR